MYCKKCGTYNDEDREVCKKCGFKLDGSEAETPIVKESKTTKTIFIGIGIVIILLIGFMFMPTTNTIRESYTVEYQEPVYKTVEHNDPIYEYTYITSKTEGSKEYLEQISESGYLFIEKENFDEEITSTEYSNEYWNLMKQYMSCTYSGDVEAVNYNPQYSPKPDDPQVLCNSKEEGIDKLISTLQWNEKGVEDQTVYKIRTTVIHTVTRHSGLTDYNTWSETVIDKYVTKEKTEYRNKEVDCLMYEKLVWNR